VYLEFICERPDRTADDNEETSDVCKQRMSHGNRARIAESGLAAAIGISKG